MTPLEVISRAPAEHAADDTILPFEVSALDPAALALACVLMTLIGILAALIPARRAAGVDPMTVLRNEG